MTLERLERRAREIGRQVEEGATRLQRQTALVALREVVFATPVDEGRARSNWIVSPRVPSRETREPFSPGQDLGSGESQNAGEAIQQGRLAIETHTPGADIYISNNLPYIRRLNEGWSAQAPEGFIEAAVQRAQEAVRRARLLGG